MSVSTKLREFLVGHNVLRASRSPDCIYGAGNSLLDAPVGQRHCQDGCDRSRRRIAACCHSRGSEGRSRAPQIRDTSGQYPNSSKGIAEAFPTCEPGAVPRLETCSVLPLRHVTGAGRLHRVQWREPYRHYSDGLRRLQATGKTDDDRPGRTSPSAGRLSRQVVLEAADYTCNPRSFHLAYM